jgi:hypothetical protein
VVSQSTRASQEVVTVRTRQIHGGRERPDGLGVWLPPFATLERTHGMNRKSRNRRELLLREPCRRAERLQLRAK